MEFRGPRLASSFAGSATWYWLVLGAAHSGVAERTRHSNFNSASMRRKQWMLPGESLHFRAGPDELRTGQYYMST
ncbi:hypothetical protein K438DRAFT_1829559 [Mycena galopus ATCC 62051]|nr:hypothetical protein K438DRAFT_1829559 [Mycena galopus ATCC 62051]